MAEQFNYYDDWKTAILHCDCGWTGTFEEGLVSYYRELMDSSCPVCYEAFSGSILAIVSYPTLEESEANRKKMSESEKEELDKCKQYLDAWEATCLKSEEELPGIAGQSLTLTWDFLEEGSDRFTVIKHREQEIWRELAGWESKRRFKEVVNILKKKYGSRLSDVVPTPQSELYLYGDDWGADDFVKSVRASIQGDTMEEKNSKYVSRFDCPVCGENIIDFNNENGEFFSGSCDHVLVYSFVGQDFGDYDESMEDVVSELEERLAENEEHVDDDDYEELTMIDLLEEYAANSNGKYALYYINDPNSPPPLNETVYFLVRMINEEEFSVCQQQNTIEAYTEAIRLKPDDAQLYVDRGIAYCDIDKYQLAIEDYSAALLLQPDYDGLLLNRGLAYSKLGQYQHAIEDYNEVLRIQPGDVNAYTNRGDAYCDLKEYKRASEDYTEAIRLMPNLAYAYENRGLAYSKLGQNEEAIGDYNKAINLNPNAFTYYDRGNTYYKLGHYKLAITDLNEAIRIKPDYAPAYNNRGAAYEKIGQQHLAKEDYDKAASIKSNDTAP